MKRDQFKKLIKESVKETLDEQKTILKEQDEFCDEMLYLTVNTTMAQNFTGYFPYTVDDFYSWLTNGTPPPGNVYYLNAGGGGNFPSGEYTLPDTYAGLEIPDIVNGGLVTSLAQVLEIVMPDAMGAFTQNEDGSLEGDLSTLNSFPNIGYLFPLYGGDACWTASLFNGANWPEGCLTYEQLIDFIYTCGEGWGCTDLTALNYDENADIDDGSCEYAPVEGCTVPGATNYNSEAEIEDGSCEFEFIACYDEVMDLAMSNQENLIGAGTIYEFTSGCGPVTGGYLFGNTYYMPESGMACGGIFTCYDSIAECEESCEPGDECDVYQTMAEHEICCNKCIMNNGILPENDPCAPHCECCPTEEDMRWRCDAGAGMCISGFDETYPFTTQEECEQQTNCGDWDCDDFEELTNQEQDIICCGCNPEICPDVTITLPPALQSLCTCCDKKCDKCCCKPAPMTSVLEPECLPNTTIYLTQDNPKCECPAGYIECPEKPKPRKKPQSPAATKTPIEPKGDAITRTQPSINESFKKRLQKLANIKRNEKTS